MILPTQDDNALKRIEEIIQKNTANSTISVNLNLAEEILSLLENMGYHIGLPNNINEALNSGDGVYRP